MNNSWDLPDGRIIHLLTPEQFAGLADGTIVLSINGEEKIKGKDRIDQDTRFGFLAWGTELDLSKYMQPSMKSKGQS